MNTLCAEERVVISVEYREAKWRILERSANVKVRWDVCTGASGGQKASSVPVTIIEQIAAAQENRASSGRRLNKPDRAVRFLFIGEATGAALE